jgi:thiol-disulfide isomerase/thioredoxin
MKWIVIMAALAASLSAQTLKPVNEQNYPQVVSSYRGKVVLVDFWATWCKPCRVELPQLVKLQAKLQAKGLQVVTISADEPDAEPSALKFLKDTGATGLPAYVKRPQNDDRFINAIDKTWGGELPMIVIYDKAGKPAKIFKGETPLAQIEAAVAKLL